MLLKFLVLVNGEFPFCMLSQFQLFPLTAADADKLGDDSPRQIWLAKTYGRLDEMSEIRKEFDDWGCRVEDLSESLSSGLRW